MSDPKFSIIIPCYNAAQYLGETIDSVIRQSIGFEQHVQLILVDDGSEDDTVQICESFASQYPSNIIFCKQPHRGVSNARNVGLRVANGEIIGFLDSDDKWDHSAFAAINDYFEGNPNVSIAAARIIYFDAWNTPHALDYKFDETKTVNIFETPDLPQLSACTVFYRSHAIAGIEFPSIAIGEDFLFVSTAIIKQGVFGLVKEAVYYYRKRKDDSSAMDNNHHMMSYYNETLKTTHEGLLDVSRVTYGFVIPYVQFAIMYDLQWRIIAQNDGWLDSSELKRYKNHIAQLLGYIDDEVICKQRRMSTFQKAYALSMRHGLSYQEEVHALTSTNKKQFSLATDAGLWFANPIILIELITVKHSGIIVEGSIHAPLEIDDLTLEARLDNESIEATLFKRYDLQQSVFFEDGYGCGVGFKFVLPTGRNYRVSFAVVYRNNKAPIPYGFGPFCKLTKGVAAYFVENNHVVVARKNNKLEIATNPSFSYLAKREIRFDLNTVKAEKKKGALIALRRFETLIKRRFHQKKEIWLVSDRIENAGDNGEAFFRYLQTKRDSVDSYFALSEQSSDFERMRSIGKVVKYGTRKYRSVFLNADYVLSSSFDAHVYKQFGKLEHYYKNLYRFKYVFLQHGITKDDMSKTLGRFQKNIALFVTAAPKEYDSIVNGKYYYDESNVVLSGFPRHDALLEDKTCSEKIVLIAPTWRNGLVSGYDSKTQQAIIHEEVFVQSDFYKAYLELLSNESLINALRLYGYRIRFVLHPGFIRFANKFPSNDMVQTVSKVSYREEFNKASMMITDYSSVAFDFALLEKPVLYYQFDEEDVLLGGKHIYNPGYFDYRTDGFGPVLSTQEQIVDGIIKLLENNCNIEEEYKSRIRSFYFVPPEGKSRCELLFNAITNGADSSCDSIGEDDGHGF